MRQAALAGYQMRPDDRNRVLIDILWWRNECNKSGGRRCVILSVAALKALKKGHVSKDFWVDFYAEFNDLEIKDIKVTSVQRAKQCSRKVSARHPLHMHAAITLS